MPSIQVDYNNAQFTQFLQFANASGEKDVARLGATDRLGTRTITAHQGDSVHAFHRSAEAKIHNDATRTAFRNAVAAMFGGERNIPENVKKAMLLSDYGKGKPLTARRILAVKAEVDKVVADAPGKCEARLAELGRKVDATSKALIREAIQECHCDKDLLDIVTRNIDRFVLRPGRTPPTAQTVRTHVAELAASFAELRQAANGDEGVLTAGRRFLTFLLGASLPRGLVSALVGSARTMELGHIHALSPDSSEIDIHRALSQLNRNTDAAMASTGADAAITEAPERAACRKFLAELMLRRGGDGAVARARAALETESAHKLATFYYDLAEILPQNSQNFDFTEDDGTASHTGAIGYGERMYAGGQANAYTAKLDELKAAVDAATGVPDEANHSIPPLRNPVRAQDIPGHAEIVGDIVRAGRLQGDREAQLFVNEVVQGRGPGAGVLRDIFAVRTEQKKPHDPKDAMMQVCQVGMKPRIAQGVADDARRFAGGTIADAKAAFLNAVARGTTILMPGETPLSGDPDKAFDQFAELVTKGAKHRFEDLDAKERHKAFVAMALVTRNVEQSAMTGLAEALDPHPGANGPKPTFLTETNPANGTRTMSFKWDGDGFSVSIDFHREVTALRIPVAPGLAGAVVNAPPPPPEPEPEPLPPLPPRRPGAPQQPGFIASILANRPQPAPRPQAAPPPPPAPPQQPFATIHAGPGSAMDARFKFSIKEAEFNRMANAGDFQIGDAESACNRLHFAANIN